MGSGTGVLAIWMMAKSEFAADASAAAFRTAFKSNELSKVIAERVKDPPNTGIGT